MSLEEIETEQTLEKLDVPTGIEPTTHRFMTDASPLRCRGNYSTMGRFQRLISNKLPTICPQTAIFSSICSENTSERLFLSCSKCVVCSYKFFHLFQTLGAIPVDSFLQRVMSARTTKIALWSCFISSFSVLALSVPPIIIGAIAANTGKCTWC